MRLIDADDLLENFRKCYNGHMGMENSDSMMMFRSICRIINNQPTVYNKDFKDGYEKALDDILDLMRSWSANIQKIRGTLAFFTYHDIARQIELLRKED